MQTITQRELAKRIRRGDRFIVAKMCPDCDGRGDIGPARSAEGDWLDQPCPRCHGVGCLSETETTD